MMWTEKELMEFREDSETWLAIVRMRKPKNPKEAWKKRSDIHLLKQQIAFCNEKLEEKGRWKKDYSLDKGKEG